MSALQKRGFSRLSMLTSLAIAPFAMALAGCGSQLPARHVKAAQLGTLADVMPNQPIIIEFEAGETIPLTFSLNGPFVKSPENAPPIPLVVKRRFFLLIDKDGIAGSADGVTFREKPAAPGQFQFGVGATKEGVKANVSIVTPVPKGLTQ